MPDIFRENAATLSNLSIGQSLLTGPRGMQPDTVVKIRALQAHRIGLA
jgi:hypothetical protein